MDREIEKLQEEIVYLKRRIASLEKSENHRKAGKYFKMIVKIIMICVVGFMLWRGYDHFVNGIPKLIDDKIQSLNPFRRN